MRNERCEAAVKQQQQHGGGEVGRIGGEPQRIQQCGEPVYYLYTMLVEDVPNPLLIPGTKLYIAPPSAPVGVEAAKHWHDLYRKECQLRQDDAARYGQQIVELEALAQQPAAVDGAMPEGWRVMPFAGTWQACDERWEVYSPNGSGGVVLASDVRSRYVADLLDALATQHREPTT